MSTSTVPLDLVMGGFASGKTSLIRRVLGSSSLPVSVILNDVQILNSEVALLGAVAHSVETITGGCMCCAAKDELTPALAKVLDAAAAGHGSAISRIVLECAGSAHPDSVLGIVARDAMASTRFRIGKVVLVIDCSLSEDYSVNLDPAVLAMADIVILAKADLASAHRVEELRDSLEGRTTAEVFVVAEEHGIDTMSSFWMASETGEPRGRRVVSPESAQTTNRSPAETNGGITETLLEWEGTTNWAVFGIWLSLFVRKHSDSIRRIKGELRVGDSTLLVNAVGRTIYPPEEVGADTSEGMNRLLVVHSAALVEYDSLLESATRAARGKL